jgi:biotin transport system substrate-specific component
MNSMPMSAVAAPRGVLGDLVLPAKGRTAVLVAGGALLTVLGAQISIPVPPSPVPITGQTLAVVLAGAALGARRGAASQALYLLLGLFLPVYADGEQGLEVVWGATGGYLVGFIVAAALVGALAERGADRRHVRAFAAFAVGQLAIFGIGVPWLKASTGMAWEDAIHNGFVIFIVGGLIKAALAAGLTSSAWRLARRVDRRDDER